MFVGHRIHNLVMKFKLVVLQISTVVVLFRTKRKLVCLYRSKVIVLKIGVVMRHRCLVVVGLHTNFTGCYTSFASMVTIMHYRLNLDSLNWKGSYLAFKVGEHQNQNKLMDYFGLHSTRMVKIVKGHRSLVGPSCLATRNPIRTVSLDLPSVAWMGFMIDQAYQKDFAYHMDLASKYCRRGCSSLDYLIQKDPEDPSVFTFHQMDL